MEFVEEEIDIKYEYDTDDLDLDHDLGSSSHCPDWKLYPSVECRVMLERMKNLDSEKEVQRDPDESCEEETETSSGHTGNVDKCCGVYRKLKLLVDVLKNCEKRENCGLCEKYIHQLQQHLLTHGNDDRDDEEMNSTESQISLSASACEPLSLDRTDVPSEMNNMDVKISHDGVPENSGGELVPSLTIASESERESTFRDKDARTIYRKSIPKGGKSKPYKCYKCQMTFLTFYELTQHKSTHPAARQVTRNIRGNTVLTPASSNEQGFSTGFQKQQFKCDICRKGFNCSSKLIRHKRIHTGEKPYKCDVCGNCFTQNGTLAKHKLSHIGEKRENKCDMCGKCFVNRTHLTRHILVHTGEKPYKCDICGRCFLHNFHLARHKLIHTGEKPYRCDLCGKCFARHTDLMSHKLVHTGEKPHKCGVCGKFFARKYSLTSHMQTHSGQKPYKCELCGKCFKFHSSVNRHKLIHTT